MDNITAEHVENSVIFTIPKYVCPVHGEIKNRTMEIKDIDNDVVLANCCIHCLADLINKNTPKIEQID